MRRLLFLLSSSALFVACGSAGGFPERDAGPPGRDAGPRDAGPGVDCSQQSPNMTFFFTREGNRSGDFGGLAGADAICAAAASAAGSTRGGWVAYLSALDDPTFGRIDARDRIGQGPWFNYCGEQIGDGASIHNAGIRGELMFAEDGYQVDAENPNATLFNRAHDIFTGTDVSGGLVGGNGPDDPPQTCADWTSSAAGDTAWVGHEDTDNPTNTGAWNDAHPTTGCDENSLGETLAIGRIYCFSTETPPPRDGGVRDAGFRDGGVRDGGFRDGGPRDGGEMRECTPAANMSFFMTEQGSGPMGGNLGGLAGADAICQAAASAAGAGGRTWRAYLSALADPTFGRVDARDRIGAGPWFNYDGTSVGDLAFIHHENGGTGIAAPLMKSACGYEVDAINPNATLFDRAHDIFTGSDSGGRLVGASDKTDPPQTCADWTSSSPSDTAWVGHEDTDSPKNQGTWNDAHPTIGCDETSLAGTLAIGRIYCFAID
ncbi:MAG: hypothetical protein RIT81_03010 [Deltaproteobacteria bacterium]